MPRRTRSSVSHAVASACAASISARARHDPCDIDVEDGHLTGIVATLSHTLQLGGEVIGVDGEFDV